MGYFANKTPFHQLFAICHIHHGHLTCCTKRQRQEHISQQSSLFESMMINYIHKPVIISIWCRYWSFILIVGAWSQCLLAPWWVEVAFDSVMVCSCIAAVSFWMPIFSKSDGLLLVIKQGNNLQYQCLRNMDVLKNAPNAQRHTCLS